ncbi:MAG: protein-export chaperone SecB [Bacteroidetes bacterium]|nr:protein-export chaperone SecB [Bacteroidota bacterium]
MSNLIAQLQLRDYSILFLSVEANQNIVTNVGDQVSSSLEIDFDLYRKDREPNFKLLLDVNVNPREKDFQRAEYRIRIKLQSFLEFAPSLPEHEIPKILVPNGLAMTYSIARGVVGQATGTSLHNKFMLPSVNFIELIKQKIENGTKKGKRVSPKK